MNFRRQQPSFIQSVAEKKRQSVLKSRLTRLIKNENSVRIRELLTESQFLLNTAFSKSCEYGKVNMMEFILSLQGPTYKMSAIMIMKLYQTACAHHQVLFLDWIENYRFVHNIQMNELTLRNELSNAFRKGYKEVLTWVLKNHSRSFHFHYPHTLNSWASLEWMVENNRTFDLSPLIIESWCKDCFRKRHVGVPLWLKLNGIKITQDAEMLIFVYNQILEPLKNTVGDDVYGLIMKYI
jgi:hypothetical protein